MHCRISTFSRTNIINAKQTRVTLQIRCFDASEGFTKSRREGIAIVEIVKKENKRTLSKDEV